METPAARVDTPPPRPVAARSAPRYHPADKPLAPNLRSRVTNGKALFVDGASPSTSPWARRYRDLVFAHIADAGGSDSLSEAELGLIKRASAIELELEMMEGKLSLGEHVDLDKFGRAASHLRRLWEALGLKRKPKDVTSLGEVLRQGHNGAARP